MARLRATAVPFRVWTKRVPFWPVGLVADVEAAGLVIGAVGRARHLAVLAGFPSAGHPGFQVELAVCGAARGRPSRCREHR